MPDLAGIEFVQTIGRGAMGAVYLARQTALNRYVAAKQILGAWNGDPEMLARFQREARALAQMNHPNVVGIYDLSTSGNDLFMIMEYVRGPSLRQLMDRQQLTVAQGLRTLGDTAAALEYASKLGIVHRDLKPGNVFVTISGSSKLGDFGLVKMLSGQSNFQTQAGTILGTPAYMSPEQAAGKGDIDQRTDVYSLAVMAYELLTGRLPFPSIPGNIMASLDAHISQSPPKPSDIVPGFPKQVEAALLNGLAKEPKKRPKTAGDLWRKIQSAADKAWPGWQDNSDLSAIALEAAPPAPPPLPAPGTPPMIEAAAPGLGAGAATVATGPPTVPPYAPPNEPPAMAPPPAPSGAPSLAPSAPPMTGMAPSGAPPMAPPPSAGPSPAPPLTDQTMVRPPLRGDETMVHPPPALDETMVRPMPTPDETVVRPTSMPDETMVRPAAGPSLDETIAMPAGGGPAGVTPPPLGAPSPPLVAPPPPGGSAPTSGPQTQPAFAPLPPLPPQPVAAASPVAPVAAPTYGATPGAAGTSPVTGSWAAPQVETPVYKPPPTKKRRRGGFGRFILVVFLLLVLVLVGVGAFLYLTNGGNPFAAGGSLTVSAVTTTVDPATGKCPNSQFTFKGVVHTNGTGGDLTYQWVKPDGTTTNPSVATVKNGEKDVPITLQFTYQGNGSAEGDAVLRVLKPTNLSSQAVHITYTCP